MATAQQAATSTRNGGDEEDITAIYARAREDIQRRIGAIQPDVKLKKSNIKAELGMVVTLNVVVPSSIKDDPFEAATEPYRFGIEEWGEMERGISISPDGIQSAIDDEDISKRVRNFLVKVLALPYRPDEYFFYRETAS